MKNRRSLPTVFKTTKLKGGEILYRRRAHLLAYNWRSTWNVYILSTEYVATSSQIEVRARGGPKEVVN